MNTNILCVILELFSFLLSFLIQWHCFVVLDEAKAKAKAEDKTTKEQRQGKGLAGSERVLWMHVDENQYIICNTGLFSFVLSFLYNSIGWWCWKE